MIPRRPFRRTLRSAVLLATCAAAAALAPGRVAAQVPTLEDEGPHRFRYFNPLDSMYLAGTLHLPEGEGPFPGVVLVSLAGVDELVDGLTGMGFAVFAPERRGLATIEHLLRATFDDLAQDVRAAADFLRARPEVDPERIGVIAQGGETWAALLAAVEEPRPDFLVMLSTTGLPGDETFRLEQHAIAVDRRYDADELAEFDAFLEALTRMVLEQPSPGARAFRMREMLAGLGRRPPINASFPPNPEDQVRFYASTWYRELFLFRPEEALSRLEMPVLVVMGDADPFVPWEAQMPPVERSLAQAPGPDATVCLVSGMVQHSMDETLVWIVERWIGDRGGARAFAPRPDAPALSACLDREPGAK